MPSSPSSKAIEDGQELVRSQAKHATNIRLAFTIRYSYEINSLFF